VDLFPRPLLSRLPFLHAVEDVLASSQAIRPLCITLFWRGQKPDTVSETGCGASVAEGADAFRTGRRQLR
jgi:hypothetical protein